MSKRRLLTALLLCTTFVLPVQATNVINGTFDGKSLNSAGGALRIEDADSAIKQAIFTNNTAGNAGAVLFQKTDDVNFLIEDSRFGTLNSDGTTAEGNSATSNGGAIYLSFANSLTIKDSGFYGNNAGNQGGAIFSSRKLFASGSEFIGNTATQAGGAIITTRDAEIIDCNFEQNTATQSGGAIYTKGSKLTVSGSSFNNNNVTDHDGGAIYTEAATVINNNSTFTGNSSTKGYGGAIYAYNTLDIADSTFQQNSAARGGAIYVNPDASKIEINNSTFSNNTAAERGGAIYTTVNTTISNNTKFTGNTANQRGGAIYAENGVLNIEQAEFSRNTAQYSGGAIYTTVNTTISNNTKFTGNTANQYGGAIYAENGVLNIEQAEFSRNTAQYSGGAIATATVNTGTTNINNSSFTNNNAQYGGAIGNFANMTISNTTFDNNKAIIDPTGGPEYNEGGGAIFLGSVSNTAIINSLFENNESNFKGGAITTRYANGNDNSAAKLSIENSTFKNNTAATTGGAIDNTFYSSENGKGIYLSGNTFQDNHANAGGAIYNHGDLDKTNSAGIISLNADKFISNTANEYGGAVYNATNATTIVGDSTYFESNKAGRGGAIYNYADATLTVKDNVKFITNEATTDAGGAIQNFGTTTIGNNAKFDGNKAVWGGAAIYQGTNSATASATTGPNLSIGNNASFTNNTLANTTATSGDAVGAAIFIEADTGQNVSFALGKDAYFYNNSAKQGGAIYFKQATIAAAIDEKATFDNNTATQFGGAIFTRTELDLNKATFTNNQAGENGGAIYTEATLTLTDTDIKNNTAQNGAGIYTNKDVTIKAVTKDVTMSGNVASVAGNDMFVDNSSANVTLNAAADKSITIASGISGANGYNVLLNSDNAGSVVLNSAIENATVTVNSGIFQVGQNASLVNSNLTTKSGSTFSTVNNSLDSIADFAQAGSTVKLEDGTQVAIDINAATGEADNFAGAIADGDQVVLTELNSFGTMMSTDEMVNIDLVEAMGISSGQLAISSELQQSTQTVLTPIRYLTGSITQDGLLQMAPAGNSYKDFNPAVMISPVAAQMGGYLVQLNSYDEAFRNLDMKMLMTREEREFVKNMNRYAVTETPKTHVSAYSPEKENSAWVRPYASFEKVNLKGGPGVNNVMYGSFFGADSDLIELENGVDLQYSVYAGYNGSHQTFSGNSIFQNGGTLGATAALYKGNFFTALTANVGASVAEATTMYGSETLPMIMAGIASKTGYNWELAKGKFIVQPSYLMSYSFVNTFDYTNAAGVKMTSDPLNAIQISPGLKFIGNLKNGWQPYASVNMVWNIMDKTDFTAAQTNLPQLSVKPYVQYGVGVQKRWGERLTGFFQTMLRNGGRNGVALSAGFRFAIGKAPSSVHESTQKTVIKKPTSIKIGSYR